ncbi:MAG: YbaK/EbsC family protein [Bacteroidota bacterium]
MPKTSDLQRYLNNNGIPYSIIEHEPVFSAHGVALATHAVDKECAKSVILSIDNRYWMAVLRADEGISMHLVKLLFGAREVQMAHEENLGHLFPDCQLGAMPPFGNLYGLPILLDASLLDDEEITFNACTVTKSIRMRMEDYRRLVHPLIGRFAQPIFVRSEE